MSAKARKRAAVAEVRELAASLGVSVSREKTDLKEPEFAALQREVRGHCNSPGNIWESPLVRISRFRESPGTANIGGGNLQDFPGTLPGTANLGSGNLHPVCNLKF